MKEDYFKDIYKDFFGIESLPKIEVKKEEKKEEVGPQEKTEAAGALGGQGCRGRGSGGGGHSP